MFKVICIVVILAAGAIVGIAATKPDDFRVERSVTINAPADEIFGYINDLKQWDAWSPWAKRDPAMKKTLSGAESGKGAIYEWAGNDEVGQGRMEIIDSQPSNKVSLRLNFIKPFEAQNISEFMLSESDGTTAVTWGMHGANTFIQKILSVFVSMDAMVGPDFESGLAAMKALAEK